MWGGFLAYLAALAWAPRLGREVIWTAIVLLVAARCLQGLGAAMIFAPALALIVAAPAAATAFQDLLGGNGRASVNLASALADIVSLCLIGPLLLIAIELRGGLFSWPWGLITACRVSWLFYDAAAALGLTLMPGVPLYELFRGLALNLLFAAGVAQAMVVRAVRHASV